MDNFLDILIQEKFKKLLEAKRDGELYDFKKELKEEIMNRKEEIKKSSKSQWDSVEKILREMEKSNIKNENLH